MRCKWMIGFCLIAVLFMLTACGTPKDAKPLIVPSKAAPNEMPKPMLGQKNIALVMKTLTNPFFVEMERGARRAEKELGINLIVKTGAQETSVDQQIAIVEELIKLKVDAIVIAPASSVDLIPVLKKAQDARISIINIDNRLDGEVAKKIGLVDIPFISVDNEQGAYLAAKAVGEKLLGPVDVLVIEGIRAAKNAQERTSGTLRAFKEKPNIRVVAVETANWKIDEAYAVTRRQFSQNPSIAAVVCGNDMMALGAVRYLREANRNDVLVGGFDALEEARKAVNEGRMLVTVDQQADMQGYQGVKMALQKISSGPVVTETQIDVKLVRKTGNSTK
jgi:ribose transport system substrate-binding protein